MNKSETIGALALALSKLQGEVKNVVADKEGYGYMYADLASVLDAVRPLLAKNELSVTQLCNTADSGAVTVETVLLHSSGEWLSTSIAVPTSISKGLSAAQSVGVCITYGRRYALCALVGVAQVDEDTDAALPEQDESNDKQAQSKITNNLKDLLSPAERLNKLIEEKKLQDKIPDWLKHFKVESLDKLKPADAVKLIKTIEGKV